MVSTLPVVLSMWQPRPSRFCLYNDLDNVYDEQTGSVDSNDHVNGALAWNVHTCLECAFIAFVLLCRPF